MNVTHDYLRAILSEVRGAKVVSIVAETEVKLTGGKKNPLNGRVTKIAHVNGMINWIYENSVNNQRVRENQPLDNSGNVEGFIAEARAWGKRLHLDMGERNRILPFVHHIQGTKKDGQSHKQVTAEEFDSLPTEELYLEFKPQNSIEYKYYIDGKEATKEEIEPHLPDKSSEGRRQEIDKIVRVRDYKFVNIKQVRIDGEIYQVA